MNFPSELRYTKEHEWVRYHDGIATIGITEFAQNELGDIVFVDVNKTGKSVLRNEIFGTIEAVKTVSDLFSPLSGSITAVNPLLEHQPDLVNRDPYGFGWIIQLKPNNASELDELMDADAYQKMVR